MEHYIHHHVLKGDWLGIVRSFSCDEPSSEIEENRISYEDDTLGEGEGRANDIGELQLLSAIRYTSSVH